jgi:hypothetical protein
MFPFASLRFYEHSSNMSCETLGVQLKCPPGFSVERCERRQQEFSSQMAVNDRIRSDMIVAARQRAQRNEYHRKQPQRLQQEHEDYYRRVQQAVAVAKAANATQSFVPWKNFSHDSFADFSVLGFPKAGTSQLYKLLVSHSQTGKFHSA